MYEMDELSSDNMSDVSVLSRTPSPPRYMMLPTPPLSRDSPAASPSPSPNTSMTETEEEGPPPAKRRRLSPSVPRETTRLDLRDRDLQSQKQEVDRLIKALRNKRKIVVVAGAGISVSAGIPDFRSATGLFNSLKTQYNLKASGKELFDASVYQDANSTASFHDMIRTLHHSSKSALPTPFHHLVARLSQEGRLLRLYTQNVDGIDTSLPPLATQVPLPAKGPWPKTIQLHGGLEKTSCTKCHEVKDLDPSEFESPIPPECTSCQERDLIRTENLGRRSHGVGRLRPRMVLYNEHNPDDEAIGSVTRADLRTRPDAILVVGTSLKIPGVRRIVREMCGIVRDRRDGFTAWINNDPEPSGKEFEDCWDMIIKGTSDDVARLVALPQWDEPEEAIAISEEDAESIVLSQEVHVVLPPTPARTPRPTPQPMTPIKSIELDMYRQSNKPTAITKANATRTTKTTSKTKAAPASKTKKAPATKAPTRTTGNAKLSFRVTKGAVNTAGTKKKGGVPLSPSTKSNSQPPKIMISLKPHRAIA